MFGIGSLARYESYDQVGEGTYGYVFKARDKKTLEFVALKRLIFHKESAGFPLCAIREIKFLKSLKHKNIVVLKDIVTSKNCEHLDSAVLKRKSEQSIDDPNLDHEKEKEESNAAVQLCGSLYLVFEYVEHDLGGLVDAKYKFSQRAVKCIVKQLLEALDYLAEKKVIHRDIKSSNILLSNHHQLKLADFGLARSAVGPDGRDGRVDLTNNVVTMWYKSPELLLGSVRYSGAIDVWSAGCVLAELELCRPLFPGKTEVEQFDLVTKVLGTPTEDTFVGLSQMPNYNALISQGPQHQNSLRSAYAKKLTDQTLQLLERALTLDPDRRPSPKTLLTHAYFYTYPTPPTSPTELEPLQITPGTSLHEFETKQRRKQQLKDGIDDAAEGNALSVTAALYENPTTATSSSSHAFPTSQAYLSSMAPSLSESTVPAAPIYVPSGLSALYYPPAPSFPPQYVWNLTPNGVHKPSATSSGGKPMCNYYLTHRFCKFGSSCKFSHDVAVEQIDTRESNINEEKKQLG